MYTIERMKKMSEFCKCGSIMISGSCTNKNCSNKLVKPSSKTKSRAVKSTTVKSTTIKAETKATNSRRASKCITYNINDLIKTEE